MLALAFGLGPPVVPFLTPFFGEGSPTKIDKIEKQKQVGTNLFYSLKSGGPTVGV